MKKFEQLPEKVQEQVKEILMAYPSVSVTFENGEYHYGGDCIKDTYADDYEVIGDYKDTDIFTEEERIINYVESFHDYPIAYKGKRDYKWLKSLRYDYDIKVKFDENGNLVTKRIINGCLIGNTWRKKKSMEATLNNAKRIYDSGWCNVSHTDEKKELMEKHHVPEKETGKMLSLILEIYEEMMIYQ